MRVATGPGRIEDVGFAGNPIQGLNVVGNLTNFDHDGDDLKPQHKKWLDTYVVPLMKLGPAWKVDIYGEASKIGNKDYNLMLSRLRAFGVEGYLKMNAGLPSSQFDLTIGLGAPAPDAPRTLDDERDRSVLISVFREPTSDPAPPLFKHLAIQWKSDPLNND
jgi:outer membrane protein OmpA-like peptidoglycan-associated protein